MNMKMMVGEAAVDYIQDGMCVGLGTGSTAYWAIQKLGVRVKAGLSIQAIATSTHSEKLAQSLGIPLLSAAQMNSVDVTIDGADEVDAVLNLIKGGGGALVREKIIAKASAYYLIIVDETKLVDKLGKFPLPIEVIPFGAEWTLRSIKELGCKARLRQAEGKAYITDNGNYIVDCEFGVINEPYALQAAINLIPGVVESGLFIRMADAVMVGYNNAKIKTLRKMDIN
jgi:ribose 5-phosphate isomerase A